MELEGAETREILPWLKLAAELDPQRIETYTVAAYWLRTRLGKTAEAEHFLREGLRSNPGSYAILFELGRLIQDNHQDLTHACNVYDLALRHWEKQEAANPQPDLIMLGQILMVSAKAEEERGDLVKAISYLDRLKAISPNPAAIQMQIDVVRGRMPVPR
jgi:tetratricopeptide (TPR) repeat protein